jgi:hypothetical protein
MSAVASEDMIAPGDALLALEALLTMRKAAFKKPLTIAVAIAEHGTIGFDMRREQIAEKGWNDRADLAIFSNARTISDLLLGRFDPEAPAEEHLFLWSGEEQDWRTLISALTGGASMLDIRAQAASSTKRPRR